MGGCSSPLMSKLQLSLHHPEARLEPSEFYLSCEEVLLADSAPQSESCGQFFLVKWKCSTWKDLALPVFAVHLLRKRNFEMEQCICRCWTAESDLCCFGLAPAAQRQRRHCGINKGLRLLIFSSIANGRMQVAVLHLSYVTGKLDFFSCECIFV